MIEWLERLYAAAGPDADRAKEALDLLATGESAEEELNDISEQIGDFYKAKSNLEAFNAIEEWSECPGLIADIAGETLLERLIELAALAERYERESFALVELCAEAGLLEPNDYKTDPIPLLRMFLPIG